MITSNNIAETNNADAAEFKFIFNPFSTTTLYNITPIKMHITEIIGSFGNSCEHHKHNDYQTLDLFA